MLSDYFQLRSHWTAHTFHAQKLSVMCIPTLDPPGFDDSTEVWSRRKSGRIHRSILRKRIVTITSCNKIHAKVRKLGERDFDLVVKLITGTRVFRPGTSRLSSSDTNDAPPLNRMSMKRMVAEGMAIKGRCDQR